MIGYPIVDKKPIYDMDLPYIMTDDNMYVFTEDVYYLMEKQNIASMFNPNKLQKYNLFYKYKYEDTIMSNEFYSIKDVILYINNLNTIANIALEVKKACTELK